MDWAKKGVQAQAERGIQLRKEAPGLGAESSELSRLGTQESLTDVEKVGRALGGELGRPAAKS